MNLESIIDRLENGANYLPHLSIDIVIMGYKDSEIKCLLLDVDGKWALPGGYIKKEESVEDAAERILSERTNLQNQHLKFLSVIGDGHRQFGQEFQILFKKHGIPWKKDYWVNNRFVSLAYYALVDINNTFPEPGEFGLQPAWFNIQNLPEMMIDHGSIAMIAKRQLQTDIHKNPISSNLLPSPFTMPQLHQLHQVILGKDIDRSRFQKKMLASGYFERLPKINMKSRGSNPYQYRLKKVTESEE